MKSLFKQKQNVTKSKQNVSLTSRGFIMNALDKIHKKWATWMNKKMAGLPINNQLILLAGFVLGTSIYSVYLIGEAIHGRPASMARISPIRKPVFIDHPHSKAPVYPIISKEEFEKINLFKNYMDSLRKSVNGRSLYDRIISERPGLTDSIQLIENLYFSTLK